MRTSMCSVKQAIAGLGFIALSALAAAQEAGSDESGSPVGTGQPPSATGDPAPPAIPPRFIPRETISAESVISFPADI